MLGTYPVEQPEPNKQQREDTDMAPKTKDNTEGTEGSTRPQPDYGVTALDELPGKPPTVRQQVYGGLLRDVADNHAGRWCRIATFHSDEGGSQKKRSIEKGKVPIPGDLSEWEFESRRGPLPEIGLDKGSSALFAKYVGDGLPPESTDDEG